MTSKSKFVRSRTTIKEFDGTKNDGDVNQVALAANEPPNEADSSQNWKSDVEEAVDERMVVHTTATDASQHLLLVSMLEHLCSVYVIDPVESRKVFKVLYKQLTRLNVLLPLGDADELSGMRSDYRVAFAQLVQSAIDNVCNNPEIMVRNHPASKERRDLVRAHKRLSPLQLLGFQSRYQEEFVEICQLGHGAYGSVYKCRNKLDDCVYAIKKIAFQDMKPDLFLKVLREVKYLAGLNHKYVVRYHGAWLEHVSAQLGQPGAAALPAVQRSEDQSLSPPTTDSPNSKSSEMEDDSVVFERSSGDAQSAGETVMATASEVGAGSDVHVIELSDVDSSSGAAGVSFVSASDLPRTSISATESLRHRKMPLVFLHIQMQVCDKTLKDWISQRNYSSTGHAEDVYNVVEEDHNQVILKQILKGLEYVHSKGLIHRDLKPKNIFLVKSESGVLHAKVGDFGLARHVDCGSDTPLTPHPGTAKPFMESCLYTSGVGTTIYASPEQLEGSHYTNKSDMFSLGLILFELYQPFRTEMERLSTLNDVRRGLVPPAFREKWPAQASYLAQLVNHNPNVRPSADQLLESDLFLSKDQMLAQLQGQCARQAERLLEQSRTIAALEREVCELKLSLHHREQQIAVRDRQLRAHGVRVGSVSEL